MAEILGTTVGMLSLGIQVCQGLCNHCSAIKSRDHDLENASRQIHCLESTFRALATVLPRAASRPSANAAAIASAQEGVASCEEGVKQLQEFLTSLNGPPREGVKGKMQDAGQKLAFGFRRPEVLAMQQKVQALTLTAELALQTLNLYVHLLCS